MSPAAPSVTVIGEALVDLVPAGVAGGYSASPGGSPYNVAVGSARLGLDTALMARLADNAFGRLLREHAAREGVDLTAAAAAAEPTTLAVVSLDEQARASYDFYVQGTADWQWTAGELARLPQGTTVLHFGSLASWTGPGDERIRALVRRVRDAGRTIISYDPNVRPRLLGDRGRAAGLIERSVALAHVVKASAEDVEWLYPDAPVAAVAERWLGLGPSVVIVTDGPSGAHAFAVAAPALTRPGVHVDVVDTVGAGDSFTAAMLAALLARGIRTPEQLQAAIQLDLAGVVDDAIRASAITCSRAGADPPTAAELARTPLLTQAAGLRDPDRLG